MAQDIVDILAYICGQRQNGDDIELSHDITDALADIYDRHQAHDTQMDMEPPSPPSPPGTPVPHRSGYLQYVVQVPYINAMAYNTCNHVVRH